MSFVSFPFLLFLAGTATVYFLVPGRIQWMVLLAASYGFYIIAGLQYLPFLLGITAVTYLGGLWLGWLTERHNRTMADRKQALSREERRALRRKNLRKKRLVLALLCLLEFGTLAAVKYSGLFLTLLHLLGIEQDSLGATGILVPLGISFYTFQAFGYLMDVYWSNETPERNPGKLALFLSFFPQIVQGPISRHNQLAKQLIQPHSFSMERLKLGAYLILWGFFKKLMIADRVAVITSAIFAENSGYRGAYILVGALAYTVRVYADFSGGIDIARGAAQILGIDLTPNFLRPYLANTITEFWRRWHVTLGTWFRDYVFYPLSLSGPFIKLGRWVRQHVNVYVGKLVPVLLSQFIVFFLIGIWHGSSLKYIAFGLYHGLLIVGGILFGPKLRRLGERLRIHMDCFSFRLFQILRTFCLVVFGRILTMGGRLLSSLAMIRSIFPLNNLHEIFDGSLLKLGLDAQEWIVLLLAVELLVVADVLQEREIRLRETLLRQNLWLRWAVAIGLLFAVLIFGVYGYGYDATDFIYRGF